MPAEPYDDPYSTLELQRGASAATIKHAYFTLVRAHPPERKPDTFKRIRAAYEWLREPDGRTEAYMLLLASAGPPAPRPEVRLGTAPRGPDRARPVAHRHGAHRLAGALSQGEAVSRDDSDGTSLVARDMEQMDGNRPMVDRLAAVDGRLEALARAIQRLHPCQSITVWGAPHNETIPAEALETRNQELANALASLEKQIMRAGREQFKATTLAEAPRDQLATVLGALGDAEAERQAELEAIRARAAAELEDAAQRLVQARREARLAFVREVLPALDGLDVALRIGHRVLDRPILLPGRRGLFGRQQDQPADDTLRQDMGAWLVGLGFVRDRLLRLLAAEGVTRIATQGSALDRGPYPAGRPAYRHPRPQPVHPVPRADDPLDQAQDEYRQAGLIATGGLRPDPARAEAVGRGRPGRDNRRGGDHRPPYFSDATR